MNKSVFNIITILQVAVLICCLYADLYESLVIILFVLCMARLILKIGNGSFFLELLHVYGAFTCLVMPLVGYEFYSRINEIGIGWGMRMPISRESYFSFNLPAVIVLGLSFFVFRKSAPDGRDVVNYLIRHLKKDVLLIRPRSILLLTGSSLIAYTISGLLPSSLQQVNTFLYYSLFASGFYIIFYKDFPRKVYLIVGLVCFIVFDAISSGMFTIIAYMSGLFLILLLADRQIYLYQKLGILFCSVLLISFVQLFKLDLRRSFKKNETISATELVTRVVSNSQQTRFDALIYPLYQRMNQGYNIALVQRRIPGQVEYLGGDYLGLSFLSALVPRLLWPDKPEAGGKENMKIYTGYIISTWSTNVGPIGEAYGNFGYVGGWVYLFAFGFFIRAVYLKFISICLRRPIFFLWMPALFFQTFYVIETDSLQAFNSLIKGAIFMLAMYKLFPNLFPLKRL